MRNKRVVPSQYKVVKFVKYLLKTEKKNKQITPTVN